MILDKVEGHDWLAKDRQSNAVVNTDSSSLAKAKDAKARIIKDRERISNLENQVNALDAKLDKILNLLSGE